MASSLPFFLSVSFEVESMRNRGGTKEDMNSLPVGPCGLAQGLQGSPWHENSYKWIIQILGPASTDQ